MTNSGWNKRGGNYDTSDLPEVLARLQQERPPKGAPTVELTPFAAGNRESGFWDRLLREHFEGAGSFPRRLKDVTKSLFGLPGQEDTITWGQSGDMSIPAIFPLTPADVAQIRPQVVHVHRDHPTTFSILTVLDFGIGWLAADAVGIEIEYTIGVGQQRVVVKHDLPVLTGATLFNGAQQVDQFVNVPLQALQVSARYFAVTITSELPQRAVTLTVLVAPVVQ